MNVVVAAKIGFFLLKNYIPNIETALDLVQHNAVFYYPSM